MVAGRLLLIEEDGASRLRLVQYLTGLGYETDTPVAIGKARRLLAQRRYDVVVSSLQGPDDSEGMELIRHAHQVASSTGILASWATLDLALKAFRNGAHDYLLKPFALEALGEKIRNIVHFHRLFGDESGDELRNQRGASGDGRRQGAAMPVLIGKSRAMAEVTRLGHKVAASPSTVLITGESGTGKELSPA